eukprot:m.353416 g.353416  ORF g.353416 m.353416 type:complete len:326 (-) comp16763_c0_seq1:374-1351(-)
MKSFLRLCAVVVLATCVVAWPAPQAADGTLYGMSAEVGLVSIDIDTGATTPIAQNIPKEGQAQNLAALDTERGIYYIIGYNFTTSAVNLLGLNVADGSVAVDMALPFVSSAFIGVGEAVDIDPTNGELFIVGLKSDNKHHLYRINPRTGSMKYLAECGYINVLGGAHAYDMSANIVWLQYGLNSSGDVTIDLFGFDATTGELKHTIPQADPVLSTLDFDLYNNQVVGFGYSVANSSRILFSLDSRTAQVSVVGTVRGYLVDNGGIATVNSRDGIVYGQFQPAGNSTAPFDLVGVHIKTASVASSATLCQQSADCPWSMEFLQTKH